METPKMTEKQKALVEKNTLLVYRLASKYVEKNLKYSDYEDLIQEGMLSLCKAAMVFDETCGNKFCTLAYAYVDGTFKRFIHNTGLLKPARSGSKLVNRVCYLTDETFKLDTIQQPNDCLITIQQDLDEALNENFTAQQIKILKMIGDRYTPKEICSSLNISLPAFKKELLRIQQKRDKFIDFIPLMEGGK
jgi:RNA polymerase sigma factor (sigma-70 family)